MVQSICNACNVGMHEHCITIDDASAPCVCNAEEHHVKRHPSLQPHTPGVPSWIGGNSLYRENQNTPRSYNRPVREVDYETEAYEVTPAGNKGAAGSAPKGDREDAIAVEIWYRDRYY